MPVSKEEVFERNNAFSLYDLYDHALAQESLHSGDLKIFLSRTTGPISTKPATVHPWVKGIQVCSNEEQFNSYKVNNESFFSKSTL